MILGAMRVCDFPHLSMTVNHLADAVDGMIFLVDARADKSVLNLVTNHPKTLAGIISTEQDFHQGRSYRTLFNMARKIDPEYIFYPDEDELLPDREIILKALRMPPIITKRKMGLRAVSMRMIYCYGDINTIALNRMSHPHAKAAQWSLALPEAFISLKGKGSGSRALCRPANYAIRYIDYPFRHLCRLDADCDERREDHALRIYKNSTWRGGLWPPPRTLPYDPTWTSVQWMTAVHQAAKEIQSERKRR